MKTSCNQPIGACSCRFGTQTKKMCIPRAVFRCKNLSVRIIALLVQPNKDTHKQISLISNRRTMSEIEATVKAIIVDKLSVDEAEVKNEASFANDLGADSLDTVELIMEFEKEFGITIPDDKSEKIATVGDAIAYIEENVSK